MVGWWGSLVSVVAWSGGNGNGVEAWSGGNGNGVEAWLGGNGNGGVVECHADKYPPSKNGSPGPFSARSVCHNQSPPLAKLCPPL